MSLCFRTHQYTFSGSGAKLTIHLFTFRASLLDEGWGVHLQQHFVLPQSTALKSFRILWREKESCDRCTSVDENERLNNPSINCYSLFSHGFSL